MSISPAVAAFLLWLQWGFLAYFICINVVYLGLNFISGFAILRYVREHGASFRIKNFADYQPPVSILVPAHNEERTIIATVRSLLRLGYPTFEVVVVNDGSTDGTLQAVVDEFGLVEFPEAYRSRLPTQPVERIFASPNNGRVRVVDKRNGGKADALNAGINTARYPLFCVVDADCKVHGMDNLYIGGSSVFCTSGQCNPTTTITALALRLGYHLARKIAV